MKKKVLVLSLIFCILSVFSLFLILKKQNISNIKQVEFSEEIDSTKIVFNAYKIEMRGGDPSKKPTEWFSISRAYPYDEIPFQEYQKALQNAVNIREQSLNQDNFTAVLSGPSNVGGRITALVVSKDDPNIIYAGAALGGIFKSIDGGQNWEAISDAVPSQSVGDIAIDPNNSNIIYFGTGEANSSGDSYSGTGIYKSENAGSTWTFLGLPNSRHIGRIVIDSTDSDIIFVAAMGTLFGVNSERGLYRTTDGGSSWEKVLYLNDSTGCIDVVINPSNTDIIYAAMWERIRKPTYRNVGGMSSGIWRTTDGGDNWSKLSNGLPPDSPTNGRIGLAIAKSDPNIVYASFVNHPGGLMGIWRTTDGGVNWSSRLISPDPNTFSGFGWYFGQIWVHPTDANTVYLGDVYLWKSTDGGQYWNTIANSIHVDHHAMYISSSNPNYIVEGNDGGMYISTNGGSSWTKCLNLPITQFYAITIDKLLPQRLYGGTQDNSTPRTLTGSIDNWDVIFYGDGFYTNIDFTNSNTIYAEAQYGYLGKSTDCGYSWDIIFTNYAHHERCNWNTPVVMSPHNNQVLFYGAERLWKTTNGGTSFNAISPDLTGGAGGGNLTFGTITTIDQSTLDANVIWAGTDDSRVWVTTDGGTNWNMVSSSLPDRWCTRVTADVYSSSTAYATFSGYKIDELLPHIYKTTDYGVSWTDISGNLTDIPVNDILVDPQIANRLYIGTDFGVYYTDDGGVNWQFMGAGSHPIIPVFDIELHDSERILVSGTHGRSMYSFDITVSGIEEITYPVESIINLQKNFPEPFDKSTNISFEVMESRNVKIDVYDINGRLIVNLTDRNYDPGNYSILFDSENLMPGEYFIRLSSEDYSTSQKITLIR